MEQTAMALSTLALASQTDRENVANVVTVNGTLTTQLNRAITTLTTIQARLNVLERNASGNGNQGQGTGGGGNQTQN